MCPVSTCKIVNDVNADLVVAKLKPYNKTRDDQLVMVYILESPYHYGGFKGSFDLTSTYRLDSDIVSPYGIFVSYDDRIRVQAQTKNYAENKTKMAAWFVSNCWAKNNRLQVANTLKQIINVDIYGNCGDLECPRSNEKACYDLLRRDYKFYLAFENSNCRDYITEKFFFSALCNDIVPVVMGGRREDYEKVAPTNSFIHVNDFESVEHLANYLKLVDSDDTLYNSYFRWKGTGEVINPYYWCRVCAVLHSPELKDIEKRSLYQKQFYDWWTGGDICT